MSSGSLECPGAAEGVAKPGRSREVGAGQQPYPRRRERRPRVCRRRSLRPERGRHLCRVGDRERRLETDGHAERRDPAGQLGRQHAAVLDPGHRGGDRPGVVPPDQVVSVEHGLGGPVADGVRRDTPAASGERLDSARERRGVLEEDAGAVLVGETAAHRTGARHKPAVRIELDPIKPDPGAAVISAGVEFGQAGLLGEPAGKVDPQPNRKRPTPRDAVQCVEIPPVPHAHLGDLDQASIRGPGQPVTQACRQLAGRLRDLGLGHVHRREAGAEHLLMEGADGGAVPGKRNTRRSREQMGVVVDESGGPDGRVPDGRVPDGGRFWLVHAPIMPGLTGPSLRSAPGGSGRR